MRPTPTPILEKLSDQIDRLRDKIAKAKAHYKNAGTPYAKKPDVVYLNRQLRKKQDDYVYYLKAHKEIEEMTNHKGYGGYGML